MMTNLVDNVNKMCYIKNSIKLNGKIVLSFLAGFTIAAVVALILCRKTYKNNPPTNVESKPSETKSKPIIGE